MIVLDDGRARVAVHAADGGAIGRYDLIGRDGNELPVFQTNPSPDRKGPYALGLNLLVPFSNRISGGGFRCDGVFHALERNSSDPYPIHGNALALPWSVLKQTKKQAVLVLFSPGPGPFRYEAEVTYRLSGEGALTCRLTVVNRAAMRLPYGAGFHPWFIRSPAVRLTMVTAGYWTETTDHLPQTYLPTAGDSRFDFVRGRPLPGTFFNNAFTGWNGRATLEWPDRGLAAELVASPTLTTVVLYSPSARADYVCFEPVSHSIDAHNRIDVGTASPQILRPGEAMLVETTITPYFL